MNYLIESIFWPFVVLIACHFGFKFIFSYFLSTKALVKGVEFKDYLRAIKEGRFRDRFFLGVSSRQMDFLTRDIYSNPGVASIGMPGSGKTFNLNTLITTEQCSNGDKTYYIMLDASVKRMGDYNYLEGLDNVSFGLGSVPKIIPALDFAYGELMARGEILNKIKASDTRDYNHVVKDYYDKLLKVSDLGEFIKSLSSEQKEIYLYLFKYDIFEIGDLSQKIVRCIENGEEISNIRDFKINRPKELAQIRLVFEEWHTFPQHPAVDFETNKKTIDSVAYKLDQIARVGRSNGVMLMLATQKGSWSEIPSDLKNGLSSIFCGFISEGSAASAVGLEEATNIAQEAKGRCKIKGNDGGIDDIQFPMLGKDPEEYKRSAKKLVDEFKKDFNAKIFTFTHKEVKGVLSQEGNIGLVKNYPLEKLVNSLKLLSKDELEIVLRRFLKEFDFTIEELNESMEKASELDSIALRGEDQKRFALKVIYPTRYGSDEGFNEDNFLKDMAILELEKVLLIDFSSNHQAKAFVRSTGGFYVSVSDLKKTANVLAQRKSLEKEGKWDQMYENLVFNNEVVGSSDSQNPDYSY
ncbi:MAG: hypothetical protein GY909_15500 [Oligoflexia bacterium]|nr:hypothetical protein [Oligoflexia bacterium]